MPFTIQNINDQTLTGYDHFWKRAPQGGPCRGIDDIIVGDLGDDWPRWLDFALFDCAKVNALVKRERRRDPAFIRRFKSSRLLPIFTGKDDTKIDRAIRALKSVPAFRRRLLSELRTDDQTSTAIVNVVYDTDLFEKKEILLTPAGKRILDARATRSMMRASIATLFFTCLLSLFTVLGLSRFDFGALSKFVDDITPLIVIVMLTWAAQCVMALKRREELPVWAVCAATFGVWSLPLTTLMLPLTGTWVLAWLALFLSMAAAFSVCISAARSKERRPRHSAVRSVLLLSVFAFWPLVVALLPVRLFCFDSRSDFYETMNRQCLRWNWRGLAGVYKNRWLGSSSDYRKKIDALKDADKVEEVESLVADLERMDKDGGQWRKILKETMERLLAVSARDGSFASFERHVVLAEKYERILKAKPERASEKARCEHWLDKTGNAIFAMPVDDRTKKLDEFGTVCAAARKAFPAEFDARVGKTLEEVLEDSARDGSFASFGRHAGLVKKYHELLEADPEEAAEKARYERWLNNAAAACGRASEADRPAKLDELGNIYAAARKAFPRAFDRQVRETLEKVLEDSARDGSSASFERHAVLVEKYKRILDGREPERTPEKARYERWLNKAAAAIFEAKFDDRPAKLDEYGRICAAARKTFPEFDRQVRETLEKVLEDSARDGSFASFGRHAVLVEKYKRILDGREPERATEKARYERWLNRAFVTALAEPPPREERIGEFGSIFAAAQESFPRDKAFDGRIREAWEKILREWREDDRDFRIGDIFGFDRKEEEYVGMLEAARGKLKTCTDNAGIGKYMFAFRSVFAVAEILFPGSKPLEQQRKGFERDRRDKIAGVIDEALAELAQSGGSKTEKWQALPEYFIREYLDADERLMWAMYEHGHRVSRVDRGDESFLSRLEALKPPTAERLIECAKARRRCGDLNKSLDDLDAACRLGSFEAMHEFVARSRDDDPRVREQLKKLFGSKKASSAEILRLARLSFDSRDWKLAKECYEAADPKDLTAQDRRARGRIFREFKDEAREFEELAAALRGGCRQDLPGDLKRCRELGRKLKREEQLHALLEALVLAGCAEADEEYIELSFELKKVNAAAWKKLKPGEERRYQHVLLARQASPEDFYRVCTAAVKDKCRNWESCAEAAALFACDGKQYDEAVKFFRMLPDDKMEKHIDEYMKAFWLQSDRSVEAIERYVKCLELRRDAGAAMKLGDYFKDGGETAAAVYAWDKVLVFEEAAGAVSPLSGEAGGKIAREILEPQRGRKNRYPFDADECVKAHRRTGRLINDLAVAYHYCDLWAVMNVARKTAYRQSNHLNDAIREKFPDRVLTLSKLVELIRSGKLNSSESEKVLSMIVMYFRMVWLDSTNVKEVKAASEKLIGLIDYRKLKPKQKEKVVRVFCSFCRDSMNSRNGGEKADLFLNKLEDLKFKLMFYGGWNNHNANLVEKTITGISSWKKRPKMGN